MHAKVSKYLVGTIFTVDL